jgi:hypothetical protein
MFKLVASANKPHFTGIVSTREFATVEEAETLMRDWARFGIDGLCDEADSLCIHDAEQEGKIVRRWSRREKRSVVTA